MKARRSCLSVPARPPRKLEKAPGLHPDEIILDLEDSVAPELKEEAREAVVDALSEADWAAAAVSVRVNGTSTPWYEDDLRAIAGAERLGSVIVPKAEAAADIERTATLLQEGGGAPARAQPVAIQALIESALGLRHLHQIAAASDRLVSLILGPADMSVSLGFPSPEEGDRWDFVRGSVLVAARAAGLQAIDGPFLQVADRDGLLASARRAREFGFDGKWALHPDQISHLNEIFTPSSEEVAKARAILEALELEPGRGAVMLEGEMIDEASRKRAELLLARAATAGPPSG